MVRLLARLLAAAIRQALWLFEWAKCSVTQGRGATPALEVPLAEVLQAAAPISQSERTRPSERTANTPKYTSPKNVQVKVSPTLDDGVEPRQTARQIGTNVSR